MNRFLCANLIKPGQVILLSDEEHHHLSSVLRLKSGAEIELFDGTGNLAVAELVEVTRKASQAKITSLSKKPLLHHITVAFGFPKAPAVEFILRRCTELGVLAFQPLLTDHSLHPDHWNRERWERWLVETAKQCQELHLPKLLEPIPLEQWLDGDQTIFWCNETDRGKEKMATSFERPALLVGPEGGWSSAEISRIERRKNVYSIGLGMNRLRVETATLAALVKVKVEVGEW